MAPSTPRRKASKQKEDIIAATQKKELDLSIVDFNKQRLPVSAEVVNTHQPIQDKNDKDIRSAQKNLYLEEFQIERGESSASAAKNFSSMKTNHASLYEQTVLGFEKQISFFPYNHMSEKDLPADPWLRLKIQANKSICKELKAIQSGSKPNMLSIYR